ncbi:MAG TPA: hypothetical protein VGM32_07270 [Rhodopila sp.]
MRQPGSVAVWFTDEVVSPCIRLAILTALTLRAVFRLAYRQAESLIGPIISLSV